MVVVPRAQHPVAMPPRRGQQLVFGGRARQRHGAQNPAARRGNLLIGAPRDALLKLRRAIAGKDQMRVRIDKARRHAPALRVDDHCVLRECCERSPR